MKQPSESDDANLETVADPATNSASPSPLNAARPQYPIVRGDRVLVRMDALMEVVNNILIPDEAKERPNRATVIAVGPGTMRLDGTYIPVTAVPGDHVILGRYAGAEVKGSDLNLLGYYEGEEWRLIREAEIAVTLRDASDEEILAEVDRREKEVELIQVREEVREQLKAEFMERAQAEMVRAREVAEAEARAEEEAQAGDEDDDEAEDNDDL